MCTGCCDILILQISNHQISADWTIPGNQLSCPAVMYGEPSQLAVAFNKTVGFCDILKMGSD